MTVYVRSPLRHLESSPPSLWGPPAGPPPSPYTRTAAQEPGAPSHPQAQSQKKRAEPCQACPPPRRTRPTLSGCRACSCLQRDDDLRCRRLALAVLHRQLPSAPTTWAHENASTPRVNAEQPLEASFAGIALDGDFDAPVYRSFGGPTLTRSHPDPLGHFPRRISTLLCIGPLAGWTRLPRSPPPAPAPISAEEAERRWLAGGNPPSSGGSTRGATFAPERCSRHAASFATTATAAQMRGQRLMRRAYAARLRGL